MKKIFRCFTILVFFLVFGNVKNVNAAEIDTDDISNSTYVIGKSMFTRDISDSYSGSLTTDVIMLAAKTIESNNLEDMIIYYKNARGVWVNALTNENIEIDETVDIEYKNNEIYIETPTLVNVSGDLTTNNLSVVSEGVYTNEELSNKLDGWELYVKENGTYEILGSFDNGESTGLQVQSVKAGDKDLTLVARVYVIVGESKIYSDYSNEVIIEALDLSAPTLVNVSGDLTTNNLSVVSEGVYTDEELSNKLDGWELYVKENGTYEFGSSFDNGESTGLQMLGVKAGDKDLTLVARVYVLVGETKIYSDYSNEVIIEALDLPTPTLVNVSGDLTTNNLSVVSEGVYTDEELSNKLDGWELYVKENGTYEILGSFDNGESTGLQVQSVKAGDKDLTLVARVYVIVGESTIYSDYSNEVVLDAISNQ